MSKEEMKGILEEIAEAQEKLCQVYDKTDGLFCIGFDRCKIHIAESRWNDVINVIQPVVTYNPNWNARYAVIEAYFYLDLCGKKYKLFALLDKEAVK